MSGLSDLWSVPPFSLQKTEKRALIGPMLVALSRMHYAACTPYRSMVDALGCDLRLAVDPFDLPFLPAGLFKAMDLMSVERSEIVKTLTSSGTTGQAVSKIYLDRLTAGNQQKALVKIVSSFIGGSRMPMLIVDSPAVVKDRVMFSARGAGILGFSIFGSERMYALDAGMKVDMAGIEAFLRRHEGKPILVFGFTFMVWQHFYKELVRLKLETGRTLDLSSGILIHGGGWKKLANEAVSPLVFGEKLKTICGLARVHDYYGLVEQTGCVCMECEYGRLHVSIFSDIITRRPSDFSPCEIGEKGIIQVLSVLPSSYPGHSVLTEDEGTLLGEDDCPCGRKGRYFSVSGRLRDAEVRGCSDTYAVAS